MNYIYDIVLNFHEQYYSFYEWRTTDKVINIRKIPIIKVLYEDYQNIKKNKVKFNQEIIKQLLNQTTLYSKTNKNKNMCLITSENETMGIMFNKEGIIIKKSSMLYEEEDETIDYAINLKITSIQYIIIKQNNNPIACRIESEQTKYVLNKIEKLYLNNNESVLKYLYYDITEKENNDIEQIYKILTHIVINEYSKNSYKIIQSINNIKENKLFN